jgi:hypothetical protein
MTPSTGSESPDERTTTSPDITHENHYSKNRLHRHHPYNLNKSSSSMLTNLDVSFDFVFFLRLISFLFCLEITIIWTVIINR